MKRTLLLALCIGACSTAPATPGGLVRLRDGMPVCRVPAGDFICGDDQGFGDEPKPHVERTGEYWIDTYEVSNAQFAAFLNAQEGDVSKYVDPEVRGLVRDGAKWKAAAGRENHPVAAATWYGAEEYARWVGGRIPTDLEWEKAARGTDGRTYPWGEELPDATLCNFLQTGLNDTAPVGSFPKGASPYGVMDMAGNVYERVAARRGQGSIRSGAWVCPMGWQMRTSDRCGYRPGSSHSAVGFRCVMDAAPR